MATAVATIDKVRSPLRNPLRDKRKVKQHVIVEMDAAIEVGRVRRIKFAELRAIGQAVADVFDEATDREHAGFVMDAMGDGDGATLETLRQRVIDKLGTKGGGLLDIILQLLPVLLPLLLSCFGA